MLLTDGHQYPADNDDNGGSFKLAAISNLALPHVWSDTIVSAAKIFCVPVEFQPELMAAIRPDLTIARGCFFHRVFRANDDDTWSAAMTWPLQCISAAMNASCVLSVRSATRVVLPRK